MQKYTGGYNMKEFIFVTGNKDKLATAKSELKSVGIIPIQKNIDIPEIQSESSEEIIKDKAQKAYDILKQPLVVSDDTWSIHGLNGFPGPYMKSVTHWFSEQDFINLTKGLKDKSVSLYQMIIYQDESGQTLIEKEIKGRMLEHATLAEGPSWANVVTLTSDSVSMGLRLEQDIDKFTSELDTVWSDVAKVLKNK
jgi:non-canonical purine NTP pyrophosphatase (RdgB/HAM1 family)